jgi:hypothetical protein
VFEKEIEFKSKTLIELRAESLKFDRATTVENFLEENTSKLSTFLELTCPKCEIELEDGDLVTKCGCTLKCTYHRTCIEEILRAGDDDCIKCCEPVMSSGEFPALNDTTEV